MVGENSASLQFSNEFKEVSYLGSGKLKDASNATIPEAIEEDTRTVTPTASQRGEPFG